MLDRYAVFTKHAHDRMRELQLSPSKTAWMLYSAIEDELPKDIREHKRQKYQGIKSLHLRYGTVLFTLVPAIDNRTKDEIYLVLSIFDQKMDIGKNYKRNNR